MFPRLSIVLAFATLNLSGQWLKYQPSGTTLKDGKPNLAAPTPLAANGKPDFTGVWMACAISPRRGRDKIVCATSRI
jgi:hypothetical protein